MNTVTPASVITPSVARILVSCGAKVLALASVIALTVLYKAWLFEHISVLAPLCIMLIVWLFCTSMAMETHANACRERKDAEGEARFRKNHKVLTTGLMVMGAVLVLTGIGALVHFIQTDNPLAPPKPPVPHSVDNKGCATYQAENNTLIMVCPNNAVIRPAS